MVYNKQGNNESIIKSQPHQNTKAGSYEKKVKRITRHQNTENFQTR